MQLLKALSGDCPSRFGSEVRESALGLKGLVLIPGQGHVPLLQARSPAPGWVVCGRQQIDVSLSHPYLSSCLFLSLPL